eukprot:TRINITY_DN2638_c0_g1_i11.p1 TRINITY_DN2638_c0_g1~~TRINITY_DN2638_c0_g1_i11.p1  ORF type:complete len:631 (-),score=63.12 TRINITY_DN2638_c0_g1_i11:459-2201(-)
MKKIWSINVMKSEIQEINWRRTSSSIERVLNPIGNLKSDYNDSNFLSPWSSLDKQYIAFPDSSFQLLLDSGISWVGYIWVLYLEDFKFSFLTAWTFILMLPSLYVFILAVLKRPVNDGWVLLITISNMFYRYPIGIGQKQSNPILTQFMYGVLESALLWLKKIGNDMFWPVILYRFNIVLSIFLMGLAAILWEADSWIRIIQFILCTISLQIITLAFVLSACVFDGEYERFMEGRSFINLSRDLKQTKQLVAKLMSSVKRSTDHVQVFLTVLAFILLVDSYTRLQYDNEIILAQALLVTNVLLYTSGVWAGSNFVSDLLNNIESCDILVLDLIPQEIGQELKQTNLKNIASIRSSEGDNSNRSNEVSYNSTSFSDLQMLSIQCQEQSRYIQTSNFIKHHKMISILQMDIVGFTSMTKEVGALKTMCMLNQLYYQLDILCENLGVYKVETVGDCYVVASSLFSQQDVEHADRILMMAVGIKNIANSMVYPDGSDRQLNIRIGISSGSVTSGLMGKSQKRYSLFGDVIKIVSKLEQSCPIDMIQVCEVTFQQLSSNLRQYGSPNKERIIGSYFFNWKDVVQY